MKVPLVFVSLCFVLGLPASECFAQAKPKEDKRIKQLEVEKKKLDGTPSPESRTKSLIKIAGITLSYVSEAATAGDFPKMQSYVDQYRQAVADARETMMRSGRDPHKKSGGYRAVEIALRTQVRALQDIARLLSVEDRQPVEAALEIVTKIRDEFIRALFGPTSARIGN